MHFWIKALHLIALLPWSAGLLFLFPLLAAQQRAAGRPEVSAALGELAKKLLYRVMHPAMAVTILLGGWLISLSPGVMQQPWFHVKLTVVVLLVGLQIFGGVARKRFSRGQYFLPARACSLLSLVPVLLLIAVMILVVVRPLAAG